MNRNTVNKEKDINLRDLFYYLILKAKWIVLGAVVMTLLLVVVVGITQGRESNNKVEETVKELDTQEIKELDEVARLETEAEILRNYLQNSIYMQIDPSKQNTVGLQYHLQASEEDSIDDLISAYTSYVNAGSIVDDIKGFQDIDSEYLTELISASSGSKSETVYIYSESANAQRKKILNIEVIYNNEVACDNLAKEVEAAIDSYTIELGDKLGSYEITKLDEWKSVIVNTEVSEAKSRIQNMLNTLNASITSIKNGFNENQKEAYKGEEIVGEESTPSIHWTVYVIIGMVLGCILMVVIFIAYYVLSKRIKYKEEFQEFFNLNIFGVYFLKKRIGIFESIVKRRNGQLKDIQEEEYNAIVVAKVVNYCKKEKIQSIYFPIQKDFAFMKVLEQGLYKEGINLVQGQDILTKITALEKAKDAGVIILLGRLERTKYDEVEQTIRLCNEFDIDIAGVIAVEE